MTPRPAAPYEPRTSPIADSESADPYRATPSQPRRRSAPYEPCTSQRIAGSLSPVCEEEPLARSASSQTDPFDGKDRLDPVQTHTPQAFIPCFRETHVQRPGRNRVLASKTMGVIA